MKTELDDAQWEAIRPLIPPRGRMGRPRADDRQVLNGILWVLRTGARWQDLPKGYGHPTTCWRRLKRWEEQGIWQRLRDTLLSSLDAQGGVAWERTSLDASFAPAKKGARASA